MKTLKLWGVPILKSQCYDLQLIQNIVDNLDRYTNSTMGGEYYLNEESKENLWHSRDEFIREMIDVWLQPQLTHWLNCCNHTNVNIKPDMFINNFQTGNSLLAHYDEYCYGNMIVYLKTDVKSRIVLFDPRTQQQMIYGSSYMVHQPLIGEILIFPGWLLHQVTSTDSQRISLVTHIRG